MSAGSFDMWKEVKRITGSAKQGNFPNNVTASTLNAHYSGISTDLSYVAPQLAHTGGSHENNEVRPDDTVSVTTVTESSVFHLLDKLKPTSAGPDELPFWFLKLAAPVISGPLAHLINNSLASGIVPKQWKTAVIHPIPKLTPSQDLQTCVPFLWCPFCPD